MQPCYRRGDSNPSTLPNWLSALNPLEDSSFNTSDTQLQQVLLNDIKADLALLEYDVKQDSEFNTKNCLTVETLGFIPPGGNGEVGKSHELYFTNRRQNCERSKNALRSEALALEMLKFSATEISRQISTLSWRTKILFNSSDALSPPLKIDSILSPHIGLRPDSDSFDELFSDLDEEVWPSFAKSEAEFCDRLSKLPVLRFKESIRLLRSEWLPDARQCAKDLLRDQIKINGEVFLGAIGYDSLVSVLAEVLESAHSRPLATTSLNGHSGKRSRLLAAVLLHLLSRTCTGSLCLEKLIGVFSSDDEWGVCVPDSRCAKPCEIIVGAMGEVYLRSLLRYRLHKKDLSDAIHGIVDVFFSATINLEKDLTCNTLLELRQKLLLDNDVEDNCRDRQNCDAGDCREESIIQCLIHLSFVDMDKVKEVSEVEDPLRLLTLMTASGLTNVVGSHKEVVGAL